MVLGSSNLFETKEEMKKFLLFFLSILFIHVSILGIKVKPKKEVFELFPLKKKSSEFITEIISTIQFFGAKI